MKKILLIITLFFITVTYSHSQFLDFMLMDEGLKVAKEKAATMLTNPQLVNALTANGEFEIPGMGIAKGEFIYEGKNIGKSNMWVYTFVEANNTNINIQIATIKFILDGTIIPIKINLDFTTYGIEFSYSNPIDENKLISSDQFAKKIVENPLHTEMLNVCNTENCMAVVGVGAIVQEYHCLKPETIVWTKMVETLDKSYCCSASYDDISTLNCDNYTDISETIEMIDISLFPNPTHNIINIHNPDNREINTINISDASGKNITVSGGNSKYIDVSYLSNGQYFISFIIGNKVIYRSFIINK